MDCAYEKPEIEKIQMSPNAIVLSGAERSEGWLGSSCFKICRTNNRDSQEKEN